MAPLPPPRGGAQSAPPPQSTDAQQAASACTFCLGLSVYSRAMADARLPPRCKGIEVKTQQSSDFIETMEQRAGKTRSDNFTLYGMGLSIYAPTRLARSGRLPVVRGLGLMVLQNDPDELMRRMEEHKRVQRELDQDDDDDGGDLVEDLGDDETRDDDGSALVEKGPLIPKPPRLPPVLPVMTFDEFVGKTVDNSKAMVHAMYRFWAKRLDGFGDRYKESCARIIAQMHKQVHSVPASIHWLKTKVKELEDQMRRGGGQGGDKGGWH